jgi:V/A-type H+/Na+-transporting ATPase subunit E
MADQLQEMLKKIYDEGLNKAKEDSDKLLDAARLEADKLKSSAAAEAEKIISTAKANAAELEKKLHSDLKMAAQQALNALKNKVISSVLVSTLDKQSQSAINDTAFLQKLILEVLSKWTPQSSLVLTVPESKKAELDAFLKDSIKNVFSGNLKVDFSPVMKNGIIVAPADGTYKLSFTDEDFANFFKSYLRPKTVQILFGE